MPDSKTLLFVFNLDSRVLQELHDYSSGNAPAPAADACPLYRITHSPLGTKKEWKRFIKELDIPSRSLDRDEFMREFGKDRVTYPVVLIKRGPDLGVLASTEELQACRELDNLIALVKERLAHI